MEIKTGKKPNEKNYKKGRSGVISYIVIHFTSNNGDTAANNINYFANNKVGASAHYFVDENNIYSSVPESDTAWHCGTSGKYYHPDCRNANSIGIEMCSRKDSSGRYYIKSETVANTVWITRKLMDKYNIPAGHILRHYDVTHKSCPEPFVRQPALWEEFKNRLKGDDIDMGKAAELEARIGELEKKVEEISNPFIYNYIDSNMPDWAREPIGQLVTAGVIKGVNDAGELGLTYADLRQYVTAYRAGAYDKVLNR